jgi:hypothetical protein
MIERGVCLGSKDEHNRHPFLLNCGQHRRTRSIESCKPFDREPNRHSRNADGLNVHEMLFYRTVKVDAKSLNY